MNRHSLFTLLGRIVILLALVLAACAQPTPAVLPSQPTPKEATALADTPKSPATPPQPAPTPTIVSQTASAQPGPTQPSVPQQNFGIICAGSVDPNQVLETTPFYVKGQVILTGPVAITGNNSNLGGMGVIVSRLAQAGFRLTPVYLCTLGIPNRLPFPAHEGASSAGDAKRNNGQAAFPFTTGANGQPNVPGNQLALNLYQFDEDSFNLLQLFEELDTLQNMLQNQEKVYADANYLTGQLGNTACGNPFGVEGSPFGVEGSPFGVEGSPYGGMSMDANAAGFWNQWAFQNIELNPPGSRPFNETGKGVRVGVFDTTPETSPYPQQAGGQPMPVTENAVSPALELTVHFPYDLPKLRKIAPSNSLPNVMPNVSDHGVFVSGLVHAMALESSIDLYRVLNESGCGDLYVLNQSILNFLAMQWNVENLGLKQPTVINLSLGIRRPAEMTTDTKVLSEAYSDIQNMSKELRDIYTGLQKHDRSLESIGTVLQMSSDAGMVIVAAAGNDSVLTNPPLPNMPLAMDIPAAYTFVLGISATNMKDGPTCYSNMGDVGAPGGDAATGVASNGKTPICKSLAFDCPSNYSPGQCPYGVMGLSTIAKTGFAYWSGTSFATPLASGLAALLLEHQPNGNPDAVLKQMVLRAHPIGDNRFGAGVINVVEALK